MDLAKQPETTPTRLSIYFKNLPDTQGFSWRLYRCASAAPEFKSLEGNFKAFLLSSYVLIRTVDVRYVAKPANSFCPSAKFLLPV